MEDYLLMTNASRSNLIGVAQLVARQRKANLTVATEKNFNELRGMNIQFTEPALLVKHRVLGSKQYEGEAEIIKYLREQQFKVVY